MLSGNGSLTLTNAKQNGLTYLKLFGACEQRNLPSGYTQYDYLRSSGTQYIDLGYKGKANTKVEIKFKYYQTSSATGSGRVFGSRTNSSTNAFALGSSSGVVSSTGNKVFWCYDGQSFYVVDDAPFGLDEWQTVVFSATEHKVNGTTEGDDYTVTTFETPSNLMLFAFDNNGTIGYGYVDIAYCKLWDDDGTLVRDLVPVKYGTTYSMYDKVSNTLLPNAGSGDFSVGNAVAPQPSAPIPIYCNNGVIEYRDTELPKGYKRILGMTMNNDCFYQTSVYPTGADTLKFSYEWTSTTACNVIGCYTTSSAEDNLSLYIGSNQTAKYLRYNGGTASSYSLANKRYDVQITPTGSIGMETEDTWEQKEFTCSVPLCIGITGASATSAKFIGNLYGNVEVVDKVKFIPCDRLSDNEIGYYDTLNKTFIEPTGTTPTSLGYDNTHLGIVVDGTVEMVANTTDNLFNKNTVEAGYYNSSLVFTSSTTAYICDYISVVSGANYILSGTHTGGGTSWNVRINYFDSSKVIQSQDVYTAIMGDWSTTITIPSGISYIRYSFYVDDVNSQSVVKCATATDLYAVGTYKDVQSVLDGAVTRNTGVKVLDGTENWFEVTGYSNLYGLSVADGTLSSNKIAIATHYQGTTANNASMDNDTIKTTTATVLAPNKISIYIKDGTNSTLANFKQFLTTQYQAGQPVIVIYPLATATTESVTAQPLSIQAGTNVIEITQASIANLPLEVKYKGTV